MSRTVSILYISHRIPYPPDKGDKIRSFNEIRYLSERFLVDLVCLADNPEDVGHAEPLRKYCRHVAVFPLSHWKGLAKGAFSLAMGQSVTEGYFSHLGMARTIRIWMDRYSYRVVLCFCSSTARFLDGLGRGRRPPSLMDFCDMDSDKWRQYGTAARFPINLVYRLESQRLLKLEKRINREFDVSIFTSEEEVRTFRKAYPGARRIGAIPNGVDSDYFDPGKTVVANDRKERPVLLFTGVMDYRANVEGILWFCRAVWPELERAVPGIRLFIVGANPAEVVRSLDNGTTIRVTGYVKDIRSWYARADICIVPLKIARGIQNKVLEAMSMEKPVVATSMAVQGIDVEPGRHLWVADTASAFADRIISMLEAPEAARVMGTAARAFVRQTYSWPVHMAQLARIVSVLGASG